MGPRDKPERHPLDAPWPCGLRRVASLSGSDPVARRWLRVSDLHDLLYAPGSTGQTPHIPTRTFGLATLPPEGLRERRERGRRSAAILLQLGQPSGARARVSLWPRVLSRRQRAFGPNPLYAGHRPGTYAAATLERERAAAGGRPCGSVAIAHSPDRMTRDRGEHPYAGARNGTARRLTRAPLPAPRQTLKLAASLRRAGMGGVWAGAQARG